jgi:hypothetical protein
VLSCIGGITVYPNWSGMEKQNLELSHKLESLGDDYYTQNAVHVLEIVY